MPMANQAQFCKKFIVSDGFEVRNMKKLISKFRRERMLVLLTAAGLTMMVVSPIPLFAAAIPAAVPISQVPLTIAIPAHPQIMIAVANSESMDGNLSGAIMAGSGSLGANYTLLNPSSSPVNFTIPAGFTPPVNPGSGGVAPYTVSVSGHRVDNSPSRLNVAKAGISAILTSFMTSADFGMLTYSTSGASLYNTWVYQMSPPGGFTFTSVAAPTGQVANPCFNINVSNSDPVSQSCKQINLHYPLQNILSKQYMNVSSSSDDPAINDVLYAGGGISAVCLATGGANPSSPYTGYTLAQFNAGGFSVHEAYSSGVNSCALDTGPTNAGFVPFSTEVIYEQRGFGYGANQAAGTGAIPVSMTTAGATPTSGSVTTALNNFLPLLAPETDGGTPEIKALAGQSPMAGLMNSALAYYATNPASSNGCAPHRYVILVTDGLPTFDLAGRSWPPLGSAAATGYGVSAVFSPVDHSLVSTNDQALTDVITKLTALRAAGVETYIVGLGAGVNPTLNPVAAATLTAMAVAGGTGDYFAATDPTTLTNDLQSILATILAATQSVAAVAVNSTGLSTNTVVYQSQFVSSDTDQDWTGNLFAFPANPATGVVDTNPVDAVWAAATKLDAQNPMTGRKIATYDPVTSTGTPFEWNTGSPASGIANSTILGQDLTTFTSDTNGQDVLQYLRGVKTLEKQNGGQFRNRTHILGDIIFSNPTYVAGPSTFNLSSSYLAFAAAHATRSPVIYVGANDGMLHAFDATSGNPTSGSELFAYIPRGVYANLINLASPFYNARHQFFVDGSPQVADVQFSDSTWHSVLFGNEGAGGKSIFAIDVTDPATIVSEGTLAASVLWDFTHVDMGLGYANPVLANTNAGTLLFVGNGYDSTNEKPFLYALNPQTGVTLTKVDLCAAVPTACNLSVANGLSTATVVNTSGQSTASANMVYAGDLQGNLWRIDISDPVPTNWTVSVILQARDSLGNPQPITTPPTVTLNPRYPQLAGTMVFVGTGQLLGIPDLANTKVQSIYGVYDPPGGYATPLTRSSLVQQFLTSATIGGVNVATVTNNAVSIPTTKGWFIDLTLNPGERVVNPPQLKSGTIIVTSTVPAPNSCSQGGLSFSYFINFATGSAFTTPQFDVNGDHVLNNSDMVHNANGSYTAPVAVETGIGFYAAATLENTNGNMPAGILVYNCPASGSVACTPRYMKGAISHRVSWWEVRQ
jgi:type IV pilus assembly protein PilY1